MASAIRTALRAYDAFLESSSDVQLSDAEIHVQGVDGEWHEAIRSGPAHDGDGGSHPFILRGTGPWPTDEFLDAVERYGVDGVRFEWRVPVEGPTTWKDRVLVAAVVAVPIGALGLWIWFLALW